MEVQVLFSVISTIVAVFFALIGLKIMSEFDADFILILGLFTLSLVFLLVALIGFGVI